MSPINLSLSASHEGNALMEWRTIGQGPSQRTRQLDHVELLEKVVKVSLGSAVLMIITDDCSEPETRRNDRARHTRETLSI